MSAADGTDVTRLAWRALLAGELSPAADVATAAATVGAVLVDDAAAADDPAERIGGAVAAYVATAWALGAEHGERPLTLWELWRLETLTSAPGRCMDAGKLTDAERAELAAIQARDDAAADAEARAAAAIFRAEAEAPRPPVPVLLDYFADILDARDPRVVVQDATGAPVAGMIASDDGAPITPDDSERVRADARAAAAALAADPLADVSAWVTESGAEMLWGMMRADRLRALPYTALAELKARIWGPRRAEHARRAALCEKGRLTDDERAAERAALGLTNVPSLSESLADAGLNDDECRVASAVFLDVGDEHFADEYAPPDDAPPSVGAPLSDAPDLWPYASAGRRRAADLHARAAEADAWDALTRRVIDAEERARVAEQEADAARRQLAERDAEQARQRRAIGRQGTGLLRALMQRADDVEQARRKAAGKGATLTPEQARQRRDLTIEPLGWAERLVIHGLVSIAHEEGRLDAHPWALQRRPIVTENPAPRVRVLFPGFAELARAAGVETSGGRIPKERREPLAGALLNLTQDHWIPQPVRMPTGERWKDEDGRWHPVYVDDVLVHREKWVAMGGTVVTRNVVLDIHPVAVVSHLVSYVEVGTLAARYEAARRAIGKRQMRDEWAALDDYLRYLASVLAGEQRADVADANGGTVRGARRNGGGRKHGPAAVHMVTVGDLCLTKDVDDATLRARCGLLAVARKRGEAEAATRMADALAFCQAMGTLRDFAPVTGKEGQAMWRLTLAHPDVHRADPAQGLLLLPPTGTDGGG